MDFCKEGGGGTRQKLQEDVLERHIFQIVKHLPMDGIRRTEIIKRFDSSTFAEPSARMFDHREISLIYFITEEEERKITEEEEKKITEG